MSHGAKNLMLLEMQLQISFNYVLLLMQTRLVLYLQFRPLQRNFCVDPVVLCGKFVAISTTVKCLGLTLHEVPTLVLLPLRATLSL